MLNLNGGLIMIKLYTDAAFKDGHSAAGILIVQNQKQSQLKSKLSAFDNHQAEFLAAILGFEKLKPLAHAEEAIFFYTDSKILYDSLLKNYSKSYAPSLNQLNILIYQFDSVFINWIPDKENKGAHTLALQALNS